VKDVEAMQVQSDSIFHTRLAGVLPTVGASTLGITVGKEMSLAIMTDFQW